MHNLNGAKGSPTTKREFGLASLLHRIRTEGNVPARSKRKFFLGKIILTEGASSKLNPRDIECALRRYATGEWGEIDAECRRQNNRRLETGGTLASIYRTPEGVRFYIITEAERETTTVLLPDEY